MLPPGLNLQVRLLRFIHTHHYRDVKEEENCMLFHQISSNFLHLLVFEIFLQGGFSSLDVTAIQRALRQQQQVSHFSDDP